jgi:hypothetical protein
MDDGCCLLFLQLQRLTELDSRARKNLNFVLEFQWRYSEELVIVKLSHLRGWPPHKLEGWCWRVWASAHPIIQ